MGEVLSKPVTEKETSSASNKYLCYGQSSMQGYRESMEDTHTAILDLLRLSSVKDSQTEDASACETTSHLMAYFAVFDGHSDQASKELHEILTRLPSFKEEEYEKALVESFVALDEIFIKDDVKGGAAAIVVMVTEAKKLIVANAGDCRAILSTNRGRVVDITEDHKPTLHREFKRITAAGGSVSYPFGEARLNGVFSLSRSFGDIEHKELNLLPQDRSMSCYPDLFSRDLSVSSDTGDEFILIACDGIWNAVSSQEAVDFVRTQLKYHSMSRVYDASSLGELLQTVSSELLDYCLKLKSLDNMSVIIIALLFGQSVMSWLEKFDNAAAPSQGDTKLNDVSHGAADKPNGVSDKPNPKRFKLVLP